MEGGALKALLGRAAAAGQWRPEPQGARWDQAQWREALGDFALQRRQTTIDPQTLLAVLDVRGAVVDDEAPAWVAALGLTTYAEIKADLAGLVARGARGVLVTVDSPGGGCAGCVEAAQAVAALAAQVPVVVHASGLMASAAYMLAAGATELWADSSALVGCIGVILPMVDESGYWEQMGIRPDYVTNAQGDLKAAGYPPSQNPEERGALQEEVEDLYAQFSGHVLAHRAIGAEHMRGQCTVAQPRGLAANLIDAVGTREQAWARLQQLV